MNELFLESSELRALNLEIDNLVLGIQAQNTYMESTHIYSEGALDSLKKSLSKLIDKIIELLQNLSNRFKTGVQKIITEAKKLGIDKETVQLNVDYNKRIKEYKVFAKDIGRLINSKNLTRSDVNSLKLKFSKINEPSSIPDVGAYISITYDTLCTLLTDTDYVHVTLLRDLEKLNKEFANRIGDTTMHELDRMTNANSKKVAKAIDKAQTKHMIEKIKSDEDIKRDALILARDVAKESAKTSKEIEHLLERKIREKRDKH